MVFPAWICKSTHYLQYNVGGMIYDRKQGKGVKKGKLPPAKKVEFLTNSTVHDVLLYGKREIFHKMNPPLRYLSIADSSGQEIATASDDEWTIGSYYQENVYKPSRYKLYVMYTPVS